MTILGFSFFGDLSTVTSQVVDIQDIDSVTLGYGAIDDLYVYGNYEEPITDDMIDREDWGNDTIMRAKYDDDCIAGSVTWTLETVSSLVVKRRAALDDDSWSRWVFVAEYPINGDPDNFNINGTDFGARSNTTYQYAVVPMLNDIEGKYSTESVDSSFEGVWVGDKTERYCTLFGTDFVDTTRNATSTVLPILNSKYPVYCSNTISNYDTGSCAGIFAQRSKDGTCEIQLENIYDTNKELMDYLTNRKAKLLKVSDGRMWLIMVTGNPTDTAQDYQLARAISFEWTEIGDCESEKDLNYAGIVESDSKWWYNA